MNIYEVIYWGSPGTRDKEDTIYLVRAERFLDAVEITQQYAKPTDHGGENWRLPDVVYEIGRDLSLGLEKFPHILRGPYYAKAFNFGWRYWDRSAEDGTDTNEWRERRLNGNPPSKQQGEKDP